MIGSCRKEGGLDRDAIEGKTMYKERIGGERRDAVEKMTLHGQFE